MIESSFLFFDAPGGVGRNRSGVTGSIQIEGLLHPPELT